MGRSLLRPRSCLSCSPQSLPNVGYIRSGKAFAPYRLQISLTLNRHINPSLRFLRGALYLEFALTTLQPFPRHGKHFLPWLVPSELSGILQQRFLTTLQQGFSSSHLHYVHFGHLECTEVLYHHLYLSPKRQGTPSSALNQAIIRSRRLQKKQESSLSEH